MTPAYLRRLGAAEVLDRAQVCRPANRWAGALGEGPWMWLATMAGVTTAPPPDAGVLVTACGLAGGMDLPATVAPFVILRGVTWWASTARDARVVRLQAWQRLATDLDLAGSATSAAPGWPRPSRWPSSCWTARCEDRIVVDVNQWPHSRPGPCSAFRGHLRRQIQPLLWLRQVQSARAPAQKPLGWRWHGGPLLVRPAQRRGARHVYGGLTCVVAGLPGTASAAAFARAEARPPAAAEPVRCCDRVVAGGLSAPPPMGTELLITGHRVTWRA